MCLRLRIAITAMVIKAAPCAVNPNAIVKVCMIVVFNV